jgi:hypothetical protein
MKRHLLLLGLLVCAASTPAGPQGGYATLKWTDSVRDIYIDNDLDRAAQFLTTENPARAALISPRFEKALILDIDARALSTTPKDAFKFNADRTEATSSSPFTAIGKFTRVDGPVYSFAVDGKPVLIRSHSGQTGEMSLDKLWETVPVWKLAMENYQPNTAAVASLKAIDKDTNLTLIFGTWCGDSKQYVPRLLKALRVADNDKLHLRLVGIDNQFREPVDSVQPRRLTNVPTVIVEREGREVGRIIETPATKTFEEDLSAILIGKANIHNGRWEHGAMIARGTYSYRDRDGKELGTESWELFNAKEGGHFLHSRITRGEQSIEVFHRIDTARRPAFAEITRIKGGNRTRTRFTMDKNTLTARMRGSSSGIITQTIEVPKEFFLCSPAIAAQGWSQSVEATGRTNTVAYLEPSEFESALGTLVDVTSEAKGEEKVRVPAGEFRTRHFVRNIGDQSSEWWIDPQLGVPVRSRAGGVDCILTSVSTASNGK